MYQNYSQTSSKPHIQNTQRHFAHHVHGVFLAVQAGSNQILANHYGAWVIGHYSVDVETLWGHSGVCPLYKTPIKDGFSLVLAQCQDHCLSSNYIKYPTNSYTFHWCPVTDQSQAHFKHICQSPICVSHSKKNVSQPGGVTMVFLHGKVGTANLHLPGPWKKPVEKPWKISCSSRDPKMVLFMAWTITFNTKLNIWYGWWLSHPPLWLIYC